MSMITPNTPNWYARGWEDYDNRLPLGQGLWVMHQNGESTADREFYKRGWRDALVVDLCDVKGAPDWMRKEMGL